MSLSQLIYLFSRINSVLYCERNPETDACVTRKHWGVMYSKSRVSCQSPQKSWDYSPSIFSAFMIVNVGFISTAAVMIIRSAWINNAASLFNSNTSKSAIYFKGKKIFSSSSGVPISSWFCKKIYIYIYIIFSSHSKKIKGKEKKETIQILLLLTYLSPSPVHTLPLFLVLSYSLTHTLTHLLPPLYLWLWALHLWRTRVRRQRRGRWLGITC